MPNCVHFLNMMTAIPLAVIFGLCLCMLGVHMHAWIAKRSLERAHSGVARVWVQYEREQRSASVHEAVITVKCGLLCSVVECLFEAYFQKCIATFGIIFP
jgi:hypothetical protein